jgi:hypothetical protein
LPNTGLYRLYRPGLTLLLLLAISDLNVGVGGVFNSSYPILLRYVWHEQPGLSSLHVDVHEFLFKMLPFSILSQWIDFLLGLPHTPKYCMLAEVYLCASVQASYFYYTVIAYDRYCAFRWPMEYRLKNHR